MTATEFFLLFLAFTGLAWVAYALLQSAKDQEQAPPMAPTEDIAQTPRPPPSTDDRMPPPLSGRDAYEHGERAGMPDEIAQGTLVTSERTYRRQGRRPFFAKVDQGFRTPDGRLVLVETKNRMRVTTSDIVQLSAQSIAVHSEVGNSLGRPADYAYVRLQLRGGPAHYRAFRLYGQDVLDRLVDRYHALKARRQYPMARPHPSRCSSCAFRRECASARVQRGR